MADFITTGQYDRHIRRMRLRYRRRRDALVDAIAGFDVGISGLSAGVNMLLTLPDGSEHVRRVTIIRPISCRADHHQDGYRSFRAVRSR